MNIYAVKVRGRCRKCGRRTWWYFSRRFAAGLCVACWRKEVKARPDNSKTSRGPWAMAMARRVDPGL